MKKRTPKRSWTPYLPPEFNKANTNPKQRSGKSTRVRKKEKKKRELKRPQCGEKMDATQGATPHKKIEREL
jgi:hypothetical protein